MNILKKLLKPLGGSKLDTYLAREQFARRNIVFLHVQKTGGSSFWHAFSKALNSNPSLNYGVMDAHHVANQVFGDVECSYKALQVIASKSVDFRLSRMIVHYHSPFGDVTNLIYNPLIIMCIRSPLQRMRSGFRHWRKLNPKQKNPQVFFEYDSAFGINYFLAGCLPYDLSPLSTPPDFFIDYIKKNVFFISLNDYKSRSAKIKFLEKQLRIPEIEPFIYSKTITDKSFDKELDFLLSNDADFSSEWKKMLDMEVLWHKRLHLDV